MSLLVPIVTYDRSTDLGHLAVYRAGSAVRLNLSVLASTDSAICRGSFGSIEVVSATNNHLVIADVTEIKKCKFAIRIDY